jgi:hypothetical protein
VHFNFLRTTWSLSRTTSGTRTTGWEPLIYNIKSLLEAFLIFKMFATLADFLGNRYQLDNCGIFVISQRALLNF